MAFLGAGSTISFNGTVFATAVSISGPKHDVNDVDVSNLLSPNLWKQFLAGWKDGGEAECEANFDPAGYAVVFGNLGVSGTFVVTFGASGGYITFPGYIKSCGTDVPLETQITMPFTVKVSGQPVYTA